ncbi:hypothetical protein PFISCL1PPCAC_4838, partial [Pristionchus fissidentatus]
RWTACGWEVPRSSLVALLAKRGCCSRRNQEMVGEWRGRSRLQLAAARPSWRQLQQREDAAQSGRRLLCGATSAREAVHFHACLLGGGREGGGGGGGGGRGGGGGETRGGGFLGEEAS